MAEKPKRKVAIISVGITNFRPRHVDKSEYELGYWAVKDALADARLSKEDIDSCVYGLYNDFFARQYQPDLFMHDYLGLVPKPATHVRAGGATGGQAIRAGFMDVASGMSDICLVLGAEKCNDCFNYNTKTTTPEVLKAISYTADQTFDFGTGRTAAGVFALNVVAHQRKFNGQPTEEQMAKVSVKNHFNATLNPIAQSPMKITVEDVMKSRKIATPFKMLDNCLYSEGAACVILASEDKAKEITKTPIWITGIGMGTDWGMLGYRKILHEFQSSISAADAAYRMARVKNPRKEIDVAELHDAFTGTEILNYEDVHFCEPGDGGRLIDEGVVELDGDLPVNTSGGLIGCGHAVGASGIMQTIEIVKQLRGQCAKRQIKNARRGLVQSMGGTSNAWTICIVLERKN